MGSSCFLGKKGQLLWSVSSLRKSEGFLSDAVGVLLYYTPGLSNADI